jgi:nucleotide-binding universal stress UspA family protein
MRILLALDSSAHSAIATKKLYERPWPEHSIVRILSVAELNSTERTPFWDSGATYEHLEEALLSEARDVVDRAANALKPSTLSIEATVRRGDPRSEIVDAANEWSADLILVGSHGRTGIARWLLGSVAEHVVRHAQCSVEVCR